jgi:hypothetical protein
MAEGTLLPLFEFCNMNGSIIFCNGGPIGWLGECQECTSLCSCEAEIGATSAMSKKVVDFRNLFVASLSQVFLSLMLPCQLFSTMTTTHASSGLTI